VLLGPAEMERLARNAASTEEPFASAWAHLRAAADAALEAEPRVYAGDNSLDLRMATSATSSRVRDLCLAYHVTGDERYAGRAVDLFSPWTAADPPPGTQLVSDEFAGGDRADTMAGLGLNVGLAATDMAIAYSLVWPHLAPELRADAETWLRALAPVIIDGHRAWIDNDYYGHQDYNNHLTGHNMGLAAIGFAAKEPDLVRFALDSADNPRDWKEMHDGAILLAEAPLEDQLWHGDPTLTRGAAPPVSGEIYDRYRIVTIRDGRGCGLPYAFFHQRMLTLTAEMARQNGIDLYGYTGPHGENLRLTFQAYAPFLLRGEPVVRRGYYSGNRMFPRQVALYELAARRYPSEELIGRVLTECDRVVHDDEFLGWAAVLLYGGE
jgi:hypothetical protein